MRSSHPHYRILAPELMAFPSISHPDSEITREVSTPLWYGTALPDQTVIDALTESQQLIHKTKVGEVAFSQARANVRVLELQERVRLRLFGWKTIQLIDVST